MTFTTVKNEAEQRDLDRLMDAMERYEQAPQDEVEEDEYQSILVRIEVLKNKGYYPIYPYGLCSCGTAKDEKGCPNGH